MSKKVIWGIVILFVLWMISMVVVTGCQKIERDIPVGSQNEEKYYRLYIVGKDDANGVVCYGNRNTSEALSCVKVK